MFSLISRTKQVFSFFPLRKITQLFFNKASYEKTPRKFEEVKIKEMQKWPAGSYKLMFVILDDDKLVLSKDVRTFCGLTGASTSMWHHSDLAGLNPVKAAGEALVRVTEIDGLTDGEQSIGDAEIFEVTATTDLSNSEKKVVVDELNNRSGHYEPQGTHLKKVVETNFSENGFTDTEGKYIELKFCR